MTRTKIVIVGLYLPGIYPPGNESVVPNLLAPAYLKAVVEADKTISNKYEIKILNFPTSLSWQDLNKKISEENPMIVAYSTYIWNYNNVIESSRELKKSIPSIKVIAGGPQVSYDSEKIMNEHSQIDLIVCGSGETKFKLILKGDFTPESLSKVPLITFRDISGRIISTKGVIREDLNQIPSPYQTKTIDLNDGFRHTAHIETFRGCPFKCGYCMWGELDSKLNKFPIDQILGDIEIVYNNPNVDFVYFIDSCLFYTKERAKTIIEKISTYERKIPTVATLDIRVLDEDMATYLSKVNLMRNQFHFGMQTMNPLALKYLGRNYSKELFRSKIGLLRRVNPSAEVSFDLIYGLPGDNFESFRETVDFAFSLEPKRLNFSPLILLPGSSFWRDRVQFQFEYPSTPPYLVYSNKDYSKKDMWKTFILINWLLAISYYPSIQELIFKIKNARPEFQAINLVDELVRVMENKIGSFSYQFEFTIESNNKIRRDFMNHLSNPENSLHFFEAASDLAKQKGLGNISKDIEIGIEYFQTLSKGKNEKSVIEKYGEQKIEHIKPKWVRGHEGQP